LTSFANRYEFVLHNPSAVREIKKKFQALSSVLDERSRRQWAATEAMSLGWGGVSAVSEATGLARNTIASGMREVEQRKKHSNVFAESRLRKEGGGRKPISESHPKITNTLEQLLRSTTRGHPMVNLKWTCKSTRNLAAELTRSGIPISHSTVASLLAQEGYSLQGNRKTKEGAQHPDRNEQFEYIDRKVSSFIDNEQPVICRVGMAQVKLSPPPSSNRTGRFTASGLPNGFMEQLSLEQP
jgi:transposase